MIIFVVELFETMEKHGRLKQFARFYIVPIVILFFFKNLLFNRLQSHFLFRSKHLTFYAALWCGEKESGGQTFTITTVVKFNNRLGRLYFFFIRPFHKVIIRSMLKRVAKRLK